MKTYQMLNRAPRHQDVLRSGGIAPRILKLGTRRRRVVGFTSRLLYKGEGTTDTHWIGGWVGARGGLNAVAQRKNPCPYWKSNPGRPAHSQDNILTELPRLSKGI